MQTAEARSNAGTTRCVKDWVWWTMDIAPAFSARISNQDGTQHVSVALRSIIPKIPGELGGRARAPWGTRGEATLTAGPPVAPSGRNFRDWIVVPGALLPTPALFFHVCGVWVVLINVLGSSRSCDILVLQNDVSDALFNSSLHRTGAVHLPG